MTITESDRNAYLAFKALCETNNNMEPINQLKIMVAAMGADRAHTLATSGADLPEEVNKILHGVARHLETLNKTS
jgi:hypothetical protein